MTTLNAGSGPGNGGSVLEIGGAICIGSEIGFVGGVGRRRGWAIGDGGVLPQKDIRQVAKSISIGIGIVRIGSRLIDVNEGQVGVLHSVIEAVVIGIGTGRIGPRIV